LEDDSIGRKLNFAARWDSSYAICKTLPHFANSNRYCGTNSTMIERSDSGSQHPKLQKSKTLPRLRLIAVLEGISFLVLLFIAMPLKYFYNQPEMVKKVGMIHGWLFVLYVVLLALAHYQFKWTLTKTFIGFVLSFVPFGTFYAEREMFRE